MIEIVCSPTFDALEIQCDAAGVVIAGGYGVKGRVRWGSRLVVGGIAEAGDGPVGIEDAGVRFTDGDGADAVHGILRIILQRIVGIAPALNSVIPETSRNAGVVWSGVDVSKVIVADAISITIGVNEELDRR